MKILHINSYYSGSSFYKNFYDKQKKSGLDIDVYVPVPSTINASSLKFGDYTTISKNHSKYDRLFFHIKHYKIYKDIIKNYFIKEYSVIHAHSLFSNGCIALKLKKNYGIPYIVAVRNTDVNIFFKYMLHLRKLGIEILRESKKVIFLSKSYRDFFIKKYVPDKYKIEISNKIEVIPNGIDDFWLKNKGIPKSYLKQNDIKLIFVGEINKNKNVTATIKAIEILRQKKYNVKFTIVGRISEERVYRRLIGSPYVNYIEPKSKEELISINRSNDIFIMPSKKETFGLVYAEAMSQGLPVIYTKDQGFDGQFNEGEIGFHVNCFKPDDIADRIIDVVNNYKKLSQNCLQLCDKFNWDLINKYYSDIY